MKKFFTFFAAALMCVSMWADPNIVTPTISGDAEFTDSVIVTMSCPSPDADIYYTTDGTTDPKCDCAAAPEYREPIVIKETTTIKAAAYDGNDWSAVAEVTFTKKGGEPQPTTVTWDSNTLSSILITDGGSFTQDGVTVTSLVGMIYGETGQWMGNSNDASFKFSTSLGNFTKIEITATIHSFGGSGWTQTSPGAVWTGEANETTFGEYFSNVSQIVFTIEEPAPTTYTLQLVADSTKGSVAVTNLLGSGIVDNGNGNYTVPANAEVTILATPNEGYEFSGWKVGNIDDMVGCYYCGTALNTEDNPYTFTMTADVAYLAEFEAEDNQQLFDLRYESKLLRVTPNELGVHYFVFIEDKVYYDNRYQQYDQPTMQDYLDYVVGVVVSMGATSSFVYNGDLNLNPDPIYHTWYDNDHMIVNHDYVAFVFKFENDARVGDVEYLAFTYAGEPQGIDSTPADVKTVKIIRDGQVLIIKNGKTYNALGAEVR